MPSNPNGLNPNGPTLHVIDVASPQGGAFEWDKVALDGVHAAWMQVDGTFARNWRESKRAGVRRAPYGFFLADKDPIAQADALSRAVEGDYTESDGHPMIDVESMRGCSAAQVLDGAEQWIERVRANLGRPTVWYTFPSFCVNPADHPDPRKRGLGGLTRPWMRDLLLWISHFAVDPNTGTTYKLSKPTVPKPWASWALWQVSGNKGPRIPGIPCDVDRDVFYGTEMDFARAFTLERDTLPVPPDSDGPTLPGTPTSKSSQRLQAVDAPILDGAATPLRAGPGEHTVGLDEVDFSKVP